MDQQYGEFVGVDNLTLAEITADNESTYATKTPEYLAPTAEIAGAPEIANKTTYYDNVAANNYVTEGKTELKLVVSNIPARKAAWMLGKNYDEVSGRVYDSGKANPPDFAVGYRFDMGKNGHRYYWFLKGNFSAGSEEASSRSNDVDAKTYTLTFTAVSTTKKWTIDGELKPLKRVFGDTADGAFDPTGWFLQVQTPDTVSVPDDIALSSSVPADNATGIAVNSNIVLTFNNSIESFAITLVEADTTQFVAASYSLDATGKILTINPTADLSATTEYMIVLSKVTDVYDQVLDSTILSFTTL